MLGCTQFSTKEDYPECRSLQAHFLGGTLTVMVGGVVVVTLLVFTVAMMVRHRVCGDCQDDTSLSGEFLPVKGVDVYSQTNGNNSVMMVAVPNRLCAQQTKATSAKAKNKVKAKKSLDSYCGQGTDKDQEKFAPESERITLYCSLAKTAHNLPQTEQNTAKHLGRLKQRRSMDRDRDKDNEQGKRQVLASLAQAGQKEESNSYSVLGEARALETKRSSSFDTGDITSTSCYSYAKRLSVIWTRRSQSLHGMLVHCASTTSTSSAGSEQYGHAVTQDYLHTYASNNSSNSNSNCSIVANPGDLEESVV